eukprot:GHVL01008007.1.p1 GENE.GHVL01008007.1~~GHVL01008007.1.p1  ORF type:complete len:127 (+),score=11.89 GHVL01008007.1:462-842(+)
MLNNAKVLFEDMMNLLENSWMTAFKVLVAKVASARRTKASQSEYPPPSTLETIATNNLGAFRRRVKESFEDFDTSSQGALTFHQFTKWAALDRTVTASCGPIKVQVAVTFLGIEQQPLYPSLDESS